MKAQLTVVLFISNGNPITKIVQGMKQRGYTGQFVTFFSGFKFIDDLKMDLWRDRVAGAAAPNAERYHGH